MTSVRKESPLFTRPTHRFIAGFLFVCSISLAFCYATYEPSPPPRVNVLWSEGIGRIQREALETEHRLEQAAYQAGRTWSYRIIDASTENIRRLVQNPAIEDTHYIDRRTFQLIEPPPTSLATLLWFILLSSLIGGTVASFTTWLPRHRWSRLWSLATRGIVELPAEALGFFRVFYAAYLFQALSKGRLVIYGRYVADDRWPEWRWLCQGRSKSRPRWRNQLRHVEQRAEQRTRVDGQATVTTSPGQKETRR